MIIVNSQIEVDATLPVEAGQAIAVSGRNRLADRHRVLNAMTHVVPFKRPDLDHEPPTARTEG